MKQENNFWMYIAGRGHSGSTMLDAMLGNAEKIESVGELISGMGRYEALCSCGEKFRHCQFWKNVRKKFENNANTPWDNAVVESVKQAHICKFPKTFFVSKKQQWVQTLIHYSNNIAKAVCGENKKVIVDSSKEITRALFLLRFLPGTKIIHLIRHPASILQSDYHRLKNGTGFKILRKRYYPKNFYAPFLLFSNVSWMIGNLLAEIVRQFGRNRVIRIKYENLLQDPVQELNRIEQFSGISLDTLKEKVLKKQKFNIGHNIGGNQMRMTGTFVFDPKKSERRGLPKRYRILTNLICWPLLIFYGYIKF